VPFTGSHPAAVLGLARCGLPSSALVIGSMTPDTPYFVPWPIEVIATHTLLGAVTIDVVLGLVVFVTWQWLLGPAAIALAPVALRRRLPRCVPTGLRFHFGGLRRAALVLAALAIGALTHVAWDSFTHERMWGPVHLRWLAERSGPLPRWEWGQYLSSVAGLLIIALWLGRWWRGRSPSPEPLRRNRYARLAWVLVGLAALAGAGQGLLLDAADAKYLTYNIATSAGMAGALASILVAIAWRIVTGRRGPVAPSSGSFAPDRKPAEDSGA
jgi:hypothetical protein